jgi:hypothetical protein
MIVDFVRLYVGGHLGSGQADDEFNAQVPCGYVADMAPFCAPPSSTHATAKEAARSSMARVPPQNFRKNIYKKHFHGKKRLFSQVKSGGEARTTHSPSQLH